MKTALLRRQRGGSAVARFAANNLRPDLVITPTLQAVNGVPGTAYTHSRSGGATVLDADGVLKWAPENRLTWSEDFTNAAWSKTNVTVTANAAVAPDGSVTADLISISAIFGHVRQLYSATAGLTYTISFWAKIPSGTNVYSITDFNTSTVYGTFTATTEWKKFDIEFTADSGPGAIMIQDRGGASSIYLWGAHLYRSNLGGMQAVPVEERGLASSSTYLPTTSTARYLERRNAYAYIDGVLTGPMSQHESAAASNLVTYSQDFTNVAWLKQNAATLALDAIGPDGQVNSAATFLDNTAGGIGEVYVGWSVTVATSKRYTYSIFAKADQLNFMAIRLFGFTSPPDETAYYNLSNGTVVSSGANQDAKIESLGNGWYRCSLSFTTDVADTSGFILNYPSSNGTTRDVDLDGTSSILIYGAQLETGPIPTSYIPTAGATATRAADTLNEEGWYNAAAMSGAMTRRITYADTGTATQATPLDWRVDANNRITITLDTAGANTGKVTLTVVNGGSSVSVTSTNEITPGVNKSMKVAWRVTASEINIALNGTAATAVSNTAGVPDLSSADVTVGGVTMIETDRGWSADIGDAGIEEASA